LNRKFQKVLSVYLFCDNCTFQLHFVSNADVQVSLTFGLCNDVTHSQSLADAMERLVPRITPLINIIIGACPYHVVHSIVTGT